MRLDTHVHTFHSGHSTIWPLHRLMRESYNTPDAVYRRAKARGMDLVTITDHDQISGVLTIADRPDVIIGCEVTAHFKHDGVKVHLGVLGLSERQFAEINTLRYDLTELLPYLRNERLFVSLNHVASRVNRQVTAAHIAALMPWLDGFEVINGSRLHSQNRTAMRLALANGKALIAGSDSHTPRGIGDTWVEAHGVTTREQFLEELKARRVTAGGKHGHYFTMAEDICRVSAGFYREHLTNFVKDPLNWRRQAMVAGMIAGSPLLTLPFVIAACHFGLEMRFNRSLLFDIGRQPTLNVAGIA
jgi:predicted metal-dependent phosphoesterase TrpH